MANITQAFVRALGKREEGWVWDDKLKGFAVRFQRDGSASYYVKYRTRDQRQRKHCIGPVSLLKADQARDRAEELIAQAKLGRDVIGEQRKLVVSPTVADLAMRHQEENRPAAESSVRNCAGYWKNHIVPMLGKKRVAEIDEADCTKLLRSIPGAGHGNNVLACLGKALRACEKWGWRPKGSNPVPDIKKNWVPHRDRILSPDELRRFVRTLGEMKAWHPRPDLMDFFMLLLLTGLRSREWLRAEWSMIDWDFRVLKLKGTSRTKNKQRVVPLCDKAMAILKALYENRRHERWIFPAHHGRGPQINVDHQWAQVCERAGLEDFHVHDLRHTLASYANTSGGASLRQVQNILGHSTVKVTAQYLNLNDEMARDGITRAAGAILQIAGE